MMRRMRADDPNPEVCSQSHLAGLASDVPYFTSTTVPGPPCAAAMERVVALATHSTSHSPSWPLQKLTVWLAVTSLTVSLPHGMVVMLAIAWPR